MTLCLSGEVMWGRLSPHPALEDGRARCRATRVAPIAFFLREDAAWLIGRQSNEGTSESLSHAARCSRGA